MVKKIFFFSVCWCHDGKDEQRPFLWETNATETPLFLWRAPRLEKKTRKRKKKKKKNTPSKSVFTFQSFGSSPPKIPFFYVFKKKKREKRWKMGGLKGRKTCCCCCCCRFTTERTETGRDKSLWYFSSSSSSSGPNDVIKPSWTKSLCILHGHGTEIDTGLLFIAVSSAVIYWTRRIRSGKEGMTSEWGRER